MHRQESNLEKQFAEEVRQYRQADHEIDPIFIDRWSPRAFSSEPVDDETLLRVFEAARWAPSSSNEQPWRFIIARNEEDRKRFVDFLMPGNQPWAKDAPVLILIVAKKTFAKNGSPNRTHAFDCGTSWGYLSLAAVQNGLITHGMAGYDPEMARATVGLPSDFETLAVIALGKRGDVKNLPEQYQEREIPSNRRPIAESIFEGRFTTEEEAAAEADTEEADS